VEAAIPYRQNGLICGHGFRIGLESLYHDASGVGHLLVSDAT
jgi:hypothetical protein